MQGQEHFDNIRVGLIVPSFEVLMRAAQKTHQTATLKHIDYVCDAEDLRAGVAAYLRQSKAYWEQLNSALPNGMPKSPLQLR